LIWFSENIFSRIRISGLSATIYLNTSARTTPSTMARGICVMAKIHMNRMNELTTPPVSAGYARASSSDVIT
jgi:hypothetical protein